MKKIIVCLLLAACVLSLCACTKAAEAEQPQYPLEGRGLYETAIEKIYQIEDENAYDIQQTLKDLNKQQKVVYILDAYDMEVQNGGLCQFLMNDTELVPLVSDALKAVGAKEHKALYDSFLKDNDIDADTVEAFSEVDIDDFAEQYSRYPFEAFDDAYYDLPPVYDLVAAYIQDNISAFS